ncbi:membrane protein [Pandoraea communis]|uniref:Membrane protein n=1 Tax=Pandoraea communis TaxID=2508297 RepID=A0A5E4TKW0_9BURK|nr:membrane protein [Pandoraea communis]
MQIKREYLPYPAGHTGTRSLQVKRFLRLWQIARHDFRVLWHAARDPRRPRWLLPAMALLVVYLISPFDLIPDFIPVFGLLDDVIVIGMVVHWLIKRLPVDVREDARAHVFTQRA